MKRLVLLFAALALVASPALAGEFTYASELEGASVFSVFAFGSKTGHFVPDGVFMYDDGFGNVDSAAIGDVSFIGYYGVGLDGSLRVPNTSDIAFKGVFVTTEVTFDDGWVTILGTLTPSVGETSLLMKDVFDGIGGTFTIPDWQYYTTASVMVTFQTSASSWADLQSGVFVVSDAYLTVTSKADPVASAVPEPATMFMVLASLGGVAVKFRNRIRVKKES